MTAAVVVVLAVTAGAAMQRVAGMGLGLMVAPVASLVLGPVAGVTVSNVAASVTALILTLVLWRDVDRDRFLAVAPLLLVGSVIGAWVVGLVDHGVLDLVLGASVLVAIAAALGLQRHLNARGRFPAYTSGAVAGFMNTTAGIAAPPMTVYAVASRWDQRSMTATLQPVFLLANLSSIATKALFGAAPDSGAVPWWLWALAVIFVPVGIGIGTALARHVSSATARKVTIAVALVGGLVTLARGLTDVLG